MVDVTPAQEDRRYTADPANPNVAEIKAQIADSVQSHLDDLQAWRETTEKRLGEIGDSVSANTERINTVEQGVASVKPLPSVSQGANLNPASLTPSEAGTPEPGPVSTPPTNPV